LIRCNSFCIARDGAVAAKAARRIDRFSREVKASDGLGTGRDWTAICLALEGEGLPLIHGLEGLECSTLESGPGGVTASRDALGTRPLFSAKSGRWVASDHRFFRGEESELLPPGASISVGKGGVTVQSLERSEFRGTIDEAADRLAQLIQAAVEQRVKDRRRVAVSFSGGLDSSLLAHCASRHTKVLACSVSAAGSVDATVAEETANELNLEYARVRLERRGMGDDLRKMDLPFEPTEMDRSLWCIYSEAARLASEGGAEVIMLGQLADELFGGYAKYERRLRDGGRDEAAGMMARDVQECGMRGFVRDELACSRWIEPSFPFADGRLASFGLSLPLEMKVAAGVRKVVLRKAALRLGLPEGIAVRQKKAAQYSSGAQKLLD
jgi:asparagine synthase (glutamine-hydrolysing)